MLKFIGTGSAFHTKLGCNSAFIEKDDSILFLDFGGDVFSRVQQSNLLNGIKEVSILITHLHPDHVGSLGDMIYNCYYILKNRATILFADPSTTELLALQGVSQIFYKPVLLQPGQSHSLLLGGDAIEITPIRTKHFPALLCVGYIVTRADENHTSLYYSGDSCEIPAQILSSFLKNEIHYLYQDTCGLDYENNPHMSINKLLQAIPTAARERVFCMHLDSHIDSHELRNLGFHIATAIL